MVKEGTYGSVLEWYLETDPEGVSIFAEHAKVHGSDGDDIIFLREGNETALAGSGNDFVYVQEGNDIVTSGLGADIIYISGETGVSNHNIITDFNFLEGDKLDLKYYGIETVAQSIVLIDDDPDGVLLSLTSEVSVLLQGVELDSLVLNDTWIA